MALAPMEVGFQIAIDVGLDVWEREQEMDQHNIVLSMPRFNGEKFNYWSNLMGLCINSQNAWTVIEDGSNPP